MQQPHGVDQLLKLLDGKTRVYIDYANVRPWSEKLQWHVDPKRLMQFYRSFPAIKEVSLYNGILVGDKRSEQFAVEVPKMGYRFRTKPVKIMRHSIDASSVSRQSTDLIAQFVRRALLRQFDIATVEYLNDKLMSLTPKEFTPSKIRNVTLMLRLVRICYSRQNGVKSIHFVCGVLTVILRIASNNCSIAVIK